MRLIHVLGCFRYFSLLISEHYSMYGHNRNHVSSLQLKDTWVVLVWGPRVKLSDCYRTVLRGPVSVSLAQRPRSRIYSWLSCGGIFSILRHWQRVFYCGFALSHLQGQAGAFWVLHTLPAPGMSSWALGVPTGVRVSNVMTPENNDIGHFLIAYCDYLLGKSSELLPVFSGLHWSVQFVVAECWEFCLHLGMWVGAANIVSQCVCRLSVL